MIGSHQRFRYAWHTNQMPHQLHDLFNFFDDSSFTQWCCYNATWGTMSFPSFCFPSLCFDHSASKGSCLVYWFWQVPVPHYTLDLRQMLVSILDSLMVLMLSPFPWVKNSQLFWSFSFPKPKVSIITSWYNITCITAEPDAEYSKYTKRKKKLVS